MNIFGVVCAGWYNDRMKKKSDYQASNRHSMMFLYQNEIVYYESEHNQLTLHIHKYYIQLLQFFAVLSAFYK